MYDSRQIRKLYWPVFIEQSFVTLINLFYTMMMAGVGTAAVSGVGLVSTINMLVINLFTAIATGVTVVLSQMLGRGQAREAGSVAGQSIVAVAYFSVGMGLLFTVFSRPLMNLLFGGAEEDVLQAADTFMIFSSISLPFQAIFSVLAGVLRAAGNNRPPMLASILSNAVYLAVAAVLIFVLGLGVAGSGIGLAAARLVSSATLVWVLLKRHGVISVPRLKWKLDWTLIKPVADIAVPTGVDSLLFNVGKLIVQTFMSGMGTAALAAYTVTFSVYNFLTLPMTAMQVVATTVVGRTFGAGKLRAARRYMFRLTGASMLLEAAAALILLPLTGFLIGTFDLPPEGVTLAKTMLYMAYVVVPILLSSSFVLPNMLRAVGGARFTMWVSIISMLVLRVALSWVLGVALGWGVIGIWVAMFADWVGRSIPFAYAALRCTWLGHRLPRRNKHTKIKASSHQDDIR